MKVKIVLEIAEDGNIDIKASTQDVAIVVLILEKSKNLMLEKVNLQIAPKSDLIIPKNGKRF